MRRTGQMDGTYHSLCQHKGSNGKIKLWHHYIYDLKARLITCHNVGISITHQVSDQWDGFSLAKVRHAVYAVQSASHPTTTHKTQRNIVHSSIQMFLYTHGPGEMITLIISSSRNLIVSGIYYTTNEHLMAGGRQLWLSGGCWTPE